MYFEPIEKVMNNRLVILILLPLFWICSCAEDRPAPQVLKTSEHNISFSGSSGAWMLTVNSNTNWTVENETNWCRVNKESGYNTEHLVVSVDSNNTGVPRSTTLRLLSQFHEVSIHVSQDTLRGDYHYKLPVIFHVIYEQGKENDSIQSVKTETLHQLVDQVNYLYRNGQNSVDMNLELVLATETPTGEALPEAGIERIQNSVLAYYNADNFLSQEKPDFAALTWDPNKYVNVYLFTCTQKDLLGVSHMALTPRQNGLEGLQANNYYYTHLPKVPWGIVLNNTFINEKRAYTTLAHELGHYLGLLHVFGEDSCDETDYCDDTPSYNRKEYEASLKEEMQEQELYNRIGCDGIPFVSYNIMDYDFSHLNQFTLEQYKRIRHVLENSPLIPGPKNIIVTKSLSEDVKPEIRIMK